MAAPPPDPTSDRFAQLRRFAGGLQLDRAVLYVFLLRLWQLLSGPVTVLLIARYFSLEKQGFYYAFGSLIGFQALFDLNVTVVLLVNAGREWTGLELDSDGRVVGDRSAAEQLASITRFGNIWYRGAALLCLLFVGGIGLLLFRQQGLAASDQLAWITAIAASSLLLTLLPRLSILQGCHQILPVNRNLALQAICSSFVVWTSLIAGLGLWAVPLSWLTRLAWDWWLVHGRFRRLFGSLRRYAIRPINWKGEVWPLQWRLAIQAAASSLVTASYVLSLFQMHSEAAAGRMGMSLSLLHMLLWGALAWVQTRVPTLSGLGKHRERVAYDRLFSRITLLTLAVVVAGALAGLAGLIGLDRFDVRVGEVRLADRFVAPLPFAFLAIAIVAQHLLNCLVIYSRTRQREPFVVPHVLLNVGLAGVMWLVAGRYGAVGVGFVSALALTIVGIPVWMVVWYRERGRW